MNRNSKPRSGHKLVFPGTTLSTDYALLWKLLHEGMRIAAWVVYTAEYDQPIWDIVEVKTGYKSDIYTIGSRGIGYESHGRQTVGDFSENCQHFSLHFIPPYADATTSVDSSVPKEKDTFICKSCNHELPAAYIMLTPGYCYMCDPNVSLEELLTQTPK